MTSRVLLAAIKHESHTFNRVPTTLSMFREQSYRTGQAVQDVYRNTGLEMGGFLDAAARHGWAITTPISVSAGSGGRVTAEALADFIAVLRAGLIAAAPLDGVLLALHGAAVAEGEDDMDGAILAMVRSVVGPAVPVALTLDPHANVSDRMAAHANIIVSYRTNPHTDHRAVGNIAGDLLDQAMAAATLPRTVIARAPTLVGFDRARTHTGHGPMIDALAEARRLETRPGIASVSINGGFSHADVWDAGPSVTVSGTAPDLQAIADRLMAEGFRRRAEETIRLATVEQGVAACLKGSPDGPVVVADYTDAPGGGAYGDGTVLLRAMIEAGVTDAAFGSIWDPVTAQQAIEAGVGARIAVKLGGWVDPAFCGTPIEAAAEVRVVSDGNYVHEGPYTPGNRGSFGPSALLRIGGVDIIVASVPKNIFDHQQFTIYGLNSRTLSVVGLKCMHGFRAAFEPTAGLVLSCDCGGLTTYDYARLPFKTLRRPIWPLDEVETK
jgi:microcystin degradation protein MlrC